MQLDTRNQYALILSGGGARAAYQVGVLKSITQYLPRNHELPFPVLCGTSAGAINTAALACYASCYHLGIRKLEWVWKNFTTSQVYDCTFSSTFNYLIANYFSGFRSELVRKKPSSLLNNQPLRKLIKQTLDFSRIERNLLRNSLQALCISASSYTHRDSISYFQGQPHLQEWRRQKRRGKACTIEVDHLIASSAIPIVFPTQKIGNEFLGDGAIHQISPLSPAIHLGASKIMIIGVDKETNPSLNDTQIHPNSAAIAGHLLDTVFADTLDADLERLQRINQTVSLFTPKQLLQTDLRAIDCLVISPSESIQSIANKYYDLLPSGIKALLKLIGVSANTDSSLLSYLLFEGPFCQELIHLGYKDGQANQDKIRAFLSI
ncbi:MAG: patatin-like phospholipase family protein [Alteromonadaceae bacterium]|nr:patatin-like phospholipase family protein [Alteromonadaceae bacterium]